MAHDPERPSPEGGSAANWFWYYLAASELDLLRRVTLSSRAVQARMVFDDGFAITVPTVAVTRGMP